MSTISLPYFWYLAWCSSPAADRPVYRRVGEGVCRRILEVGVGLGERTNNLLQIANSFADSIEYTGVDLFELRGDGPGLALRSAYQRFREQTPSVRLLPGEPLSVLRRYANGLNQIDLLILDGRAAEIDWEPLWFYVPRMLNAGSTIFMREAGEEDFRRLDGPGAVPVSSPSIPGRRAA